MLLSTHYIGTSLFDSFIPLSRKSRIARSSLAGLGVSLLLAQGLLRGFQPLEPASSLRYEELLPFLVPLQVLRWLLWGEVWQLNTTGLKTGVARDLGGPKLSPGSAACQETGSL